MSARGCPALGASSFIIFPQANGRTIAYWYLIDTYSRKVRAPVDKLPGNSWARVARANRDGQVPQKTDRHSVERMVRVKRRGKSPPRSWQHERHGKPQLEQGQICGE